MLHVHLSCLLDRLYARQLRANDNRVSSGTVNGGKSAWERRHTDTQWRHLRTVFFDVVTVSGIDGITFHSWNVERLSGTEMTVELIFGGDFDTDATLTFTVEADAIANYSGDALTATLPVTALEESLTASTEFSLTEATLDGSIVTLTLSGRIYEEYSFQIEDALTVSGIDGVTVEEYISVERVSDTEARVQLTFEGDFDTDATLTFTVGADAIAGYNQEFTAEIPVTAIEKSNATVSISPLVVESPDIGEELTFSLISQAGKTSQAIRQPCRLILPCSNLSCRLIPRIVMCLCLIPTCSLCLLPTATTCQQVHFLRTQLSLTNG